MSGGFRSLELQVLPRAQPALAGKLGNEWSASSRSLFRRQLARLHRRPSRGCLFGSLARWRWRQYDDK